MRAFRAERLDYAALGVDTENPTGALRIYERLGFAPFMRNIVFDKRLPEWVSRDSAHHEISVLSRAPFRLRFAPLTRSVRAAQSKETT